MTKRFSSRAHRCPRCQIDQRYCFCDEVKSIENTTPVVVIMHWREQWMTSNSTNIASLSLSNIETLFRGKKDQSRVELSKRIREEYIPLYLFPSDEAVELSADLIDSLEKPPALIIPDGTWSQARKFHKREPALKDLIHVKLPDPGESVYRLRTAPFEGALSTLESMAKALAIIEDPAIEERLLSVLKVMVERTQSIRQS